MKNELHHSHLHSDTPNEILKAERDVDQSRRELEFALTRLDDKIGEAVSTVENKVQTVSTDVENKVRSITDRASTAVNSLQTRVETTFGGIDQAVDRFGTQVQGWVGVGDEFSGRIDGFVSQVRSDFGQFMSRAEEISAKLRDPAEFLARNPKLAGPALLIAGMVVGILFRDSVRSRPAAVRQPDASVKLSVPTTVRKIA